MTCPEKIVSICGAPLVGKRQILDALACAADCRPIAKRDLAKLGATLVELQLSQDTLVRSRKASLPSWEGPVAGIRLRLASGAMFYRDPTIETVISRASIVCYVIASEEAGPDSEFQNDYFNSYMTALRAKNLTWRDIPWIWILNKADLGSTNPLAQQIPQEQRGEVIPTIAIGPKGIDLVWNRIVSLLGQ